MVCLGVLSISMRLLGVDAYLAAQGGAFQMNGLLIMAAIMGFAGSFYFIGYVQDDGQKINGSANY